MLSRELCNYVRDILGTGLRCTIYDDTALSVDLGIKSKIIKILSSSFNKFMFYEERVSSDGQIVVRAVPKRG